MLHLQFETFDVVTHLEFFLRIVVAGICGAIVGVERSKRFKEAGIRTHVIICASAALMMIVSKYGFIDLGSGTGAVLGAKDADPARIAAQVISGVSFIGAGVIFKNSNSIKGLTTAAGVWATAGIGLAVGSGMYILGVFMTGFLFFMQLVMHKFAIGGDALSTTYIKFTIKQDSAFKEKLDKHMNEQKIRVSEHNIEYMADGYVSYSMTIRTRDNSFADSLPEFIYSNAEVRSLSVNSSSTA
jgi:putative Mg2+ transporter-C (MgtC) family protein